MLKLTTGMFLKAKKRGKNVQKIKETYRFKIVQLFL